LAYDAIEPSGNVEPTYMLALLCATVVNTVSSIFAKKGSQNKPISPDAFIPKWADALSRFDEESEQKEQTIEEQKQALISIASMFKSSKKRTSKPPPKLRGVTK
jgi:hypothetical protein